ncbi:helix-turn-helix domain-containing protein, partial [Kitasatospora indigofera]|uniref:helix-turn-helix domain-containing protein n=1 Tax=Kitasatospora indigofera TaxID=67307 RepID=UPI00365A9586
ARAPRRAPGRPAGRRPGAPPPRAAPRQAEAVLALITDTPALVRVDQVAAVAGISVRGLQRLFAEYVGAGPKWVLRRARLHEAAARAEQGTGVDWAALAADLGYADQAHLVRDFTAVVGAPPARYARHGPLPAHGDAADR